MAGNIEECLKKFIHHVDNLCHEDEPGGNGFWREFKELREIQQSNKDKNKFPAEEGKKECNIKKNRYKDIIPYDSQRVILKRKNGDEGSDYINASYILDINKEKSYIASQGPLPHTVNDFWRMLWENKVEIVFMVCREEEQGRNKCQRYWAEEGETKQFGDIEVTLESKEEIFPDFVERQICAKCGDSTHQVKQFHYTGWPDHGIPKNSKEIYNMVGKMREERRQLHIPLVIHCSAGCGRTGTICAVDYAWTMLDQGKIAHGFSMFEIIKNIREQRQSMVQTPDQYEFVHLVVQSLCADWLEKFQEHDYANFNFIAEGEEVYYNTMGLSNNEAETDDLYQEIKGVAPSSPQTGHKKPQPTPRPSALSSEVNNNDHKKSKTAHENYENATVPNSSENKTVQSKLSSSSQNGDSKVNLPAKNVESSKGGLSTLISVGSPAVSKQPPSFTPPSPSTLSQTNAHKNAVKKMTQETVKISPPSDGSVQQTAKSRNQKLPSSEASPSQFAQQEEYGIVVKNLKTDKLVSCPEASAAQIEVGQKARENRDKQPLSSDSDAPVIPTRNYGPEDVSPTLKRQAGVVSAMGGIPPKSPSNPPRFAIGSSSGEYSEIDIIAGQQKPSTTNTLQPSNRGGERGGFISRIKGLGKQSSPRDEEPSTGIHFFRNQDIGYGNRVQKPQGPRKPKNGVWSTRL